MESQMTLFLNILFFQMFVSRNYRQYVTKYSFNYSLLISKVYCTQPRPGDLSFAVANITQLNHQKY